MLTPSFDYCIKGAKLKDRRWKSRTSNVEYRKARNNKYKDSRIQGVKWEESGSYIVDRKSEQRLMAF